MSKPLIPRIFFVLTVCATVFIVLIFVYVDTSGFFPKRRKYNASILSEYVKKSIFLPENQKQCIVPRIYREVSAEQRVWHPENMVNGSNCQFEADWVPCDDSICSISMEDRTVCQFTDIVRESDNKVKYNKRRSMEYTGVLSLSDFVKIRCKLPRGGQWSGTGLGVRSNRDMLPTMHRMNNLFNVVILNLDGLERNDFLHNIPDTHHYLTNQLDGQHLNGFNIIGNDRTKNMLAMLAGITELEHQVLRNFGQTYYADEYEMIWKHYQRHGYLTTFAEDFLKDATFNVRHKGFSDQPTDYYLRTFFLDVQESLKSSTSGCLAENRRHMVFLAYAKRILLSHPHQPKFLVGVHDVSKYRSLSDLDSVLLGWLKELNEKKILSDTILIVVSNLNLRPLAYNALLEEKQEQRMPVVVVSFPRSFQSQYRAEYLNFLKNIDRLTTPFNIHGTLKHILSLQTNYIMDERESYLNRSTSLLRMIPDGRSCAEAWIETHWCTCLSERDMIVNDKIMASAQSIVQTINNYTRHYREICKKMQFVRLKNAVKLTPKENLMRFKELDDDDGYIPNLFGHTTVHNEWYRLTVVAVVVGKRVGDMVFEGLVRYDLLRSVAETKLNDIKLIIAHERQEKCLEAIENSKLKNFCVCN